jgi:hypothetical protein
MSTTKTAYSTSRLKMIPTTIQRSGHYFIVKDANTGPILSHLDFQGVQAHRILSFGYDSDNNVYYASYNK